MAGGVDEAGLVVVGLVLEFVVGEDSSLEELAEAVVLVKVVAKVLLSWLPVGFLLLRSLFLFFLFYHPSISLKRVLYYIT